MTTSRSVLVLGSTGSIGVQALDVAARNPHLFRVAGIAAGGADPAALAAAKPGQLVPVDSEHSAIAQALRAGRESEVARLVLTASGGPFRGRKRAELADVTVEQAMAHPTWSMGPLITINSATLVNK